MNDVAQVIGEVRRVLRKGGIFSAVVGRAFLLGEPGEVFLDVLRPIAKAHLTPLPFGDARTGTQGGWHALLQRGFERIAFEDIDVDWAPTPAQLSQSILETYDTDRMSEAGREQLRNARLSALPTMQPADGTIKTGWALRLVQANAA